MADGTPVSDSTLERMRHLAQLIESGNEDEVKEAIDELTKLRERDLYQELGRLTRDLHDALNSFQVDARLANMAEQDIPDARERLRHVIKMTDDSANRTLAAVEASMPLCENIEDESAQLHEEWQRFIQRQMSADEFRDLSKRVGDFLGRGREQAGQIRGNLNDVLMAQDFQDLTGQIIKRVISLVEELELSMVNLIKLSGTRLTEADKKEDKNSATKLDGPPVPGVSDTDVVSGQDEVDDLLSSLGF